MSELYIPKIPEFAAKALEKEKNKGHLPIWDRELHGKEKVLFEEWIRRYSRKLKYARLNGWTIESEEPKND